MPKIDFKNNKKHRIILRCLFAASIVFSIALSLVVANLNFETGYLYSNEMVEYSSILHSSTKAKYDSYFSSNSFVNDINSNCDVEKVNKNMLSYSWFDTNHTCVKFQYISSNSEGIKEIMRGISASITNKMIEYNNKNYIITYNENAIFSYNYSQKDIAWSIPLFILILVPTTALILWPDVFLLGQEQNKVVEGEDDK